MVAIRLARTGAKKKPSYRVVVIDKRRARDSRHLEIVGHYNPRLDPIELVLKRERIEYWLGVGAQPSTTVERLVKYFDEHGGNVLTSEKVVTNGNNAGVETAAESVPTEAAVETAEAAVTDVADTAEAAEPETLEAAVEETPEEPAEPEAAAIETESSGESWPMMASGDHSEGEEAVMGEADSAGDAVEQAEKEGS